MEKRNNTAEKSSAAAEESKMLHLKAALFKDSSFAKPQSPPTEATTVLFSAKNNTSADHNKENTSRDLDRTQDDCFEDSGYLSLQNSQIDHIFEGEDFHTLGKPTALLHSAAAHEEKTILLNKSPSKSQGGTRASLPLFLEGAATPVDRSKRKTAAALSSTPSNQHGDPNLPILKFEQAVCERLSENFKKNKKYDWSIVQEVANEHLLDRVIGRNMGLEYVDMFESLLSRSMKTILNNVLSLLGDLDLISCKKVSKTWKRIICEDKAASRRCLLAEQQLRESSRSSRKENSGLTRDVAVSRVVLSCMQSLASSNTPSSSSSTDQSCRIRRLAATSQKSNTPNSQCSRFNEYVQAASRLKQHESLRQCSRCWSPAAHLPEVQRATCTRSSCRFDFCTRCQEAFHGSSPCRVVQPKSHFTACKTSTVAPCSARSKRNTRRL
ncbi:F-box only protein 5 [Kryptolebias marmoratus]|uniref:F-box protein 5 n=1 Tax=Kryptolebias marmoratus TaxID=37003 RepID=A0A3Q3B1W6_KRYMA|nr:F-box only protein 5 [Kryptolebias marmoratus]